MADYKELASYIMDQLAELGWVRNIPMMGGYVFYYKEKIFGGIYEDGFMVKDTKAARACMPDSEAQPPYKGAKPMLPVTILEDRKALQEMVVAMEPELPQRKQKKSRKFSSVLKKAEYDFLREDPHLGKSIILLGLGGSYSYGTDNENSDMDIRGVTLNRKEDLIGLSAFEQYVDDRTDTTVYGFGKMITLLLNCNPNTLELLGLNPEHYLYLHDLGRELLENTGLFLSKRAIQSFGGYADAQLRRLQNALSRDSYPQREKEQHIFNSVKNAMYDFRRRYERFENGSIHIYTDTAVNPQFETELFVDTNLTHYPLRDYKNIWNEMHNIVRDYDKIGKRNRKKDDNHLNKHAMHLVRLFMMAIDILEKGEVNTYRHRERELLLAIRRGEYQKEDGAFRDEFYEIVADYEKKLDQAAAWTNLPDEPDKSRVQEYVMSVNEKVVKDEVR